MIWRDMTVDEVATLPDARLTGSLAWIFWSAAALGVFYVLEIAWIFGAPAAGWTTPILISAILVGSTGWTLFLVTILPHAFGAIWAVAYVFMTLLRVRATPMAASIGAVVWIALKVACAYFAQLAIMAKYSKENFGYSFIDLLPIVVDQLFPGAILVAGFCGYMATGQRPNAYYRRRLPLA